METAVGTEHPVEADYRQVAGERVTEEVMQEASDREAGTLEDRFPQLRT